ncbi:MAG: glycosyltransferase family 2 protein [Synergistaceae bacterium]|nr:glycosyltransferase family 2 protein [Synergistaceae bacterium]
MTLEVLLSAMFLKDYRYIDTLNIKTDCVVINQCDQEKHETFIDSGRNIRFISTQERGLSKSRNMALKFSTADICLICDDDVEYVEGYSEIVKNTFLTNIHYDIIIFHVKKSKNDCPLYFQQKELSFFSILKARSVEIAFKRKSVNEISFNEMFGAGAQYSSGEENLFLFKCLQKGLKALYCPIQIASLRDGPSTWFTGFNAKYFHDKGAFFYELLPKFSFFLILRFALFKHHLYKKEISFFHALKTMLEGRAAYIKETKTG